MENDSDTSETGQAVESGQAIIEGCEAAVRDYRASLGELGVTPAAAYARGRTWELAGQPDRALDAFQEALETAGIEPGPSLLNAVVRCAQAVGREVETADWLEHRALAAPPLPELLVVAGVLLRLGGRLASSLEVLEAAIAHNGDPAVRYTATMERLHVLAGAGRLDEAREACRAAVDAQPLYADLLSISLAGLLTRSGQHRDALQEIDRVVARQPESGDAHLNRGVILLRLGRGAEAEAALARAVGCDPRLADQVEAILGQSQTSTPPSEGA